MSQLDRCNNTHPSYLIASVATQAHYFYISKSALPQSCQSVSVSAILSLLFTGKVQLIAKDQQWYSHPATNKKTISSRQHCGTDDLSQSEDVTHPWSCEDHTGETETFRATCLQPHRTGKPFVMMM